MNMKAIIPLGLAMLLGLVAAFMVKNAIAHRSGATPPAGNLVTVVVAKQNVDPGRQLTKDDLTTSKVPADAAPGQVFSNPDELVGRVAATPLLKGQTVLETLLAPNGAGSGLQALVPPGMRAITLEITQFSGVGGMLVPGCHVDIITIINDEKANERVARTVLQNIKVQAVGRSVGGPAPTEAGPNGQPASPNDVTLLCTPKQAQALQLSVVSGAGHPWIVLRSGRDGQEVPLEGTTVAELRGDSSKQDTAQQPTTPTEPIAVEVPQHPGNDPFASTPPADPMPEVPPTVVKRVVQILRGGSESQVTFVMPNPHSATADMTGPEDH